MPSFMGNVTARQILLNVAVARPGETPSRNQMVTALLDTGATISGVTPQLVERLGLVGTGEWVNVSSAHGVQETPTYRVSMVLPISASSTEAYVRGQHSMLVSELAMGPDLQNFEVLLGMDFLEPFHLTLYRQNFILSN